MLHDTAHVYSSKTVGLLLAIIPQYHNVFKTSSVTFFQHWRGKYQYVSPLNAHTFPTRQFKRCGIFGIRAHSMRHGYRLTQIRCKMRKKTWEATRDNKWEASHVEAREIQDARVIVPSIQSAALRYTKSRRYMRRWNCKKKKKHASWRKRGIRWMQMFPFYALLSEPKRMFQSNCRRLVWIVHIIQRRHNHHNVHNFNPIAGTGNLDRSWLILITDHLCDSHLARMSASLMSKG